MKQSRKKYETTKTHEKGRENKRKKLENGRIDKN